MSRYLQDLAEYLYGMLELCLGIGVEANVACNVLVKEQELVQESCGSGKCGLQQKGVGWVS